jgi:ribosomal protein L37AE/L43A
MPDKTTKEVTMPAVAATRPTKASRGRGSHRSPRGSDLPTCPVCADSMVAAEASAFLTQDVVSYLWTCDTCGYGFVTEHAFTRVACN